MRTQSVTLITMLRVTDTACDNDFQLENPSLGKFLRFLNVVTTN